MSKGTIDGIIHRLIIQNLLKAFKKVKVPRRYVSNTRGCQSGTSYRTNNAVVCCLLCREGKNVHSSALFESALYLPYKNAYKTREISVAPFVCCVRTGVYLVHNSRNSLYTRFSLLSVLRMSRLARDGTTEPVSRDQMARTGKEKTNIFPVRLITSWIDNLTRLIYSLYPHVHKTAVCSVKSGNKWTEPTLRARSFCYTKGCTNIASERGSVAPLNLSVMPAPGTYYGHTYI